MAIRYLTGVNIDSNTLFVDSANNRVGIGTASPSQKLHVNAASGAIYTRIQNDVNSLYLGLESGGIAQVSSDVSSLKVMANTFTSFETAGSERMRITNSGNVGIGTTAPVSILHVSAPKPTYTDSAVVFRGGTTNNNSHTGITLTSAGDALTGGVGSNYLVDGTSVSQSNSNRSTGYLRFANTTVAGKTSTIDIGGFVKGTTTDVSRLFIDVDGNVGIGTAAPSSRLHVVGDILASASSGNRSVVLTTNNANAALNVIAGLGAELATDGTNQNIAFRTGASTRMYIKSDGNVGIGTTAPGAKLNVNTDALGVTVSDASGISLTNGTAAASGAQQMSPTLRWSGQGWKTNATAASQNVSFIAFLTPIQGSANPSGTLQFRSSINGGAYGAGMSLSTSGALIVSNSVTATSFVKTGGTATEYLMANGSVSTLTNPVTGTGTTNYVPKFTSASAIGNSQIFDNGTNVGIAVTSPAFKLQVGTPAVVAGSDYAWSFDLTRANDTARGFSIGQGAGGGTVVLGSHNADMAFGHTFGVDANGNPAFYETMRIQHVDQAVGNVGIGTTNPSYKLDVSGTARFTGSVLAEADLFVTDFLQVSNIPPSNGNTATSVFRLRAQGQTSGVTRQSLWEFSPVVDSAFGNSALAIYKSYDGGAYAEYIRINSSGNVGIGTTAPENRLHLGPNSGNVKLALEWSDSHSATSGKAYSTIYTSGQGGSYPFGGRGNLILQPRNTDSNGAGDLVVMTGATATPKLVVQASGNVGIGTSNPSALLHVSQPSANTVFRLGNNTTYDQFIYFNGNNDWSLGMDYSNSNAFVLSNSSSIGTNDRIVVTTGGNVGIGTTSPATVLHLNRTNVPYRGQLTIQCGPTSDFAQITFYEGATTQTDLLAQIYAASSDNSLVIGAFKSDGVIKFQTNNEAERMRITSAGNVGIGTTAPSSKLDVQLSSYDGITLSRAAQSGGSYIQARSYDTSNVFRTSARIALGAVAATNAANGFITFNTYSANTENECMRITSAGNVGIGTTSPTQKLDVRGTIYSLNSGTDGGQIRVANSGGGSTWYWAARTTGLNLGELGASDGRIFIANGGNVGIGTTAPVAKLDVVATASATSGVIQARSAYTSSSFFSAFRSAPSDGSTTANSGLWMGAISDDNSTISSGAIYRSAGQWRPAGTTASVISMSTGTITFHTNSGLTANTDFQPSARMTITSAGNVGIGTTSPSTKLHVNGGSIFNQDGFLYMSNQFPIVWGAAVSIEGDNVAGTLTLKTESSHRIFINNVGNVGINTTAPQQLLHVLGATNGYMMVQGANDAGQAGIYFKKEDTTGTMNRTKGLIVFHTNVGSGFGRGHLGFCLNSADSNAIVSVSDEKFRMVDNGDFLADGDVVAYSTTISDERYKTNITPIESALDKVNQMRGVSFDWTAVRSGREFGVIAQEIEKIAPEVVSEKELLNGETMKTVSYTSLVPFLIESIKELTARVEELEQKLKQ